MTRDLRKILKMLAEKYPPDYANGINPILCIYDDGSGRIVKDATIGMYEPGNRLGEFSNLKELLEELQNDAAST